MNLPRKPKAVVFDLDGTLIDSEALVKEAHFAACAQMGVAMSETQFLALVGMHREANDLQLKTYYGDDFPLEDFIGRTRAHIGDRVAPLKAGAVELMDALDELALPFGLATSSRRPWVEKHFAAHGLTDRFRAVVTRQDCVEGKPHPEPYLNAARLLGAAPMDVLALEDSHAGVASAHAARCMTVMVPDLLAPSDLQRTQAFVVMSLHDVEALLR
ncbi:HAD family hydrolase [Terricaulis silvestris]|uniref:2-deoxyglucose-6-phosphate phosphatase n=1 Tax=Terricaulis silvestris TaxID=2686094 RepID=A0A6I6MTR1_9CAUL|nr:HAD family phosphatase [Terricaulis silvestris]QGZ95894.1 2-deoxyglucose-6-phosphate phosphatase [Terricaulis silvestris]